MKNGVTAARRARQERFEEFQSCAGNKSLLSTRYFSLPSSGLLRNQSRKTEHGSASWMTWVKSVGCHSADSDDDEEQEKKEKKKKNTMEKNVSMQSGPNAREGMKGPIASDQKIHVASTPTYSGANNGAFALKRRVVILYSAAAPIPDSIYNHQSKSPILFALFFALFIAPLFIITLLKEITACAWKPTHRHLLHPPRPNGRLFNV